LRRDKNRFPRSQTDKVTYNDSVFQFKRKLGMKVLTVVVLFALSSAFALAQADQTQAIWNDFTSNLLAGRITQDMLRPEVPELREPLMRFLEQIRSDSRPEDWAATPELHRVGNQIVGIVALTQRDGKGQYCFTLLVENSRWYFRHVESIFIRLDQIGALPVSHFPDVSEAQKAWMRDEIRVTEEIRVYNLMVKDHGRDFALRFFDDGAGYALQARTWVPTVSPEKAFVLFLCWEQANLFESPITLETLDDNSAVVRLNPRWFHLYRQTGHLRQMISESDFRELFETVWQDRARAAGWSLQIIFGQDEVVFRLKR
jgi:hypothetical protein